MEKLFNKNTNELNNILINLLKEQFNLRLQLSSKKLVQVHLIRKVKKNIARIKTILRYRIKKII